MAKLSTDDLLEHFKEMTLLELSEFIKQFEETFGVTAAAPVAVAAAPAGGGAAPAEAAAEQDEFDVILEAAGRSRPRGGRGSGCRSRAGRTCRRGEHRGDRVSRQLTRSPPQDPSQ